LYHSTLGLRVIKKKEEKTSEIGIYKTVKAGLWPWLESFFR